MDKIHNPGHSRYDLSGHLFFSSEVCLLLSPCSVFYDEDGKYMVQPTPSLGENIVYFRAFELVPTRTSVVFVIAGAEPMDRHKAHPLEASPGALKTAGDGAIPLQ